MLNAVNENKITIADIIKLCSTNPAKIFKIKNKGEIKVGYDADLTIIDIEKTKVIDDEMLNTKCKWSPFDGWELQGAPIITIVNGNIVFDEDNPHNKININVKGKELVFE